MNIYLFTSGLSGFEIQGVRGLNPQGVQATAVAFDTAMQKLFSEAMSCCEMVFCQTELRGIGPKSAEQLGFRRGSDRESNLKIAALFSRVCACIRVC